MGLISRVSSRTYRVLTLGELIYKKIKKNPYKFNKMQNILKRMTNRRPLCRVGDLPNTSLSVPVNFNNSSLERMYFTRTHEWIQQTSPNSPVALVGVTDKRQDIDGEVMYVNFDQIPLQEILYKGQELCEADTEHANSSSIK